MAYLYACSTMSISKVRAKMQLQCHITTTTKGVRGTYIQVQREHLLRRSRVHVSPQLPLKKNSSHSNTRAPALDFEDQNISFQGVAALILPSSRLDESRSPDEPLILLYMANSAMLTLVENHWGGIENAWRMNRLLQCPLWLYIDLLQACGHWSEVWGVAGHDLARRNTQAYRETSRSSTLRLTRRLHKATSNVITLRENLRLHISSTERFQEYVQKKRYQSLPMPDAYQATLSERTGELLQDLRHHWATSEVILEQFKSLMSLVRMPTPKIFKTDHWMTGLQHGNCGTRTSSRPSQSPRFCFLAFVFCYCEYSRHGNGISTDNSVTGHIRNDNLDNLRNLVPSMGLRRSRYSRYLCIHSGESFGRRPRWIILVFTFSLGSCPEP